MIGWELKRAPLFSVVVLIEITRFAFENSRLFFFLFWTVRLFGNRMTRTLHLGLCSFQNRKEHWSHGNRQLEGRMEGTIWPDCHLISVTALD